MKSVRYISVPQLLITFASPRLRVAVSPLRPPRLPEVQSLKFQVQCSGT
jgi:hypothetical protein